MTLDEYLSLPDAPSVTALRMRMNALGATVRSDMQIRQWRHGYANRQPDPVNSVFLERATEGAVSRRDCRPNDWRLIWPELANQKKRSAA